MRTQFTFVARAPSHVETTTVAKNDDWTASEVKLTFASGEPFTLYIVAPTKRPRIMQAVIYAPPGDANALRQPNRAMLAQQLPLAEFVVRSGRALVMPIWDWTYERFTPLPIEKQALR